jgi:hypothetical protein
VRRALSDLRFLWSTRSTSGLPWPFRFGGPGSRRQRARFALTGYPFYAAVPLWRQVATIPLRPWRYARMVRGIARTRAVHFNASMYDDVP